MEEGEDLILKTCKYFSLIEILSLPSAEKDRFTKIKEDKSGNVVKKFLPEEDILNKLNDKKKDPTQKNEKFKEINNSHLAAPLDLVKLNHIIILNSNLEE